MDNYKWFIVLANVYSKTERYTERTFYTWAKTFDEALKYSLSIKKTDEEIIRLSYIG